VRRGVLAAAVAAAALAGCGTPSADLFVVHRSGSIPGAKLTLLVGDGGTVRCNGGPEREITSAQLITARALLRDLEGDEEREGPLQRDLHLPAQPNSILRYLVRAEDGTVAFSDTSRAQPRVFFRVAQFTRQMAKGVCGLPR
jgi:hypothetical protein